MVFPVCSCVAAVDNTVADSVAAAESSVLEMVISVVAAAAEDSFAAVVVSSCIRQAVNVTNKETAMKAAVILLAIFDAPFGIVLNHILFLYYSIKRAIKKGAIVIFSVTNVTVSCITLAAALESNILFS